MIKEFKEFISKGNVIDLAVAVIIGGAFALIVKSFTDGILMPVLGIFGGKRSFDEYVLTINESRILWGSFLTNVVNFLIIAFSLFIVVKAVNKSKRSKPAAEAAPAGPSEVELLTEIRDALAKR